MSKFYFSEVDINYEENPHGIMDFELASTRILKLFIDGSKKIDKSSISLNKKEITFPNKIKWDIYNNSAKRIPLHIEVKDIYGKVLNSFWMPVYPLSTTNVALGNIPKETYKIDITCLRENVIGKQATLTITARN